MRLINNKKNVKITSFIVAAVFVLGIGGLAYTQMATPAMASASSNIGVIDTSKVFTAESADVKKAQEEMQAYQQQLKQEFTEKSANMDDQQKEQYFMQLQQQLNAKKTELQNNMQTKVSDAAKSVGEAKGLSIVLDKGAVLYGGVDITEQVTKKLSEGK